MTVPAQEAVVEVQGVSTRLGRRWIHRDLDLTVRRGEILALVGASGSGKTTLLRQIIGLMRPTSGTIRVLGKAVRGTVGYGGPQLPVQWGVLFQQGALFSALSVFDNVAFPLRELRAIGHRLDEASVHDLVMLQLKRVGLKPADAWKRPAELSGGMIKRAALARALALETDVLFLDEPTTGLDPDSASALDSLLTELHQDLNLSALMITHDLANMVAVSNRVAVLAEGRVLVTGSLQQVAAVDHPFIHHFFHGQRARALLDRAD